MKNIKKIMAASMAALSLLALGACGQAKDPNTNPDPAKEKITLGTSADYAPFEFHTMINNVDAIVGFDVDLAYKIAEDMGKELVIKDMAFEVLLAELQNGTIDFVIAGMSADPDRLEQADASDPYYGGQSSTLLIHKDDVEKYKDYGDFEGASVAVQNGTIFKGQAEENLTGCELLILQAVPDIVNNLINKKCDAALMDGNVAAGYVSQNPDLVALTLTFPSSNGNVVFVQKDDPKGLLESINATIEKVTTDGTMETWVTAAEELSGESAQ